MGSTECGAESYTDVNARIVDAWVADGWEWGTPVSHERYEAALGGDWSMVLTPTREVPRDWFFDDMRGKRVLGLASGGGQQMPIFAAMGCACTVLDYSEAQIASEVMVAKREGYEIRAVRADMTRPLPFEDDEEERVVHSLPFNPLRDSSLIPEAQLPEWGLQFSHTLDEQIRGQIQAGFRILDLYEDTNGEGRLHELGIPTFWATCAEKPT